MVETATQSAPAVATACADGAAVFRVAPPENAELLQRLDTGAVAG